MTNQFEVTCRECGKKINLFSSAYPKTPGADGICAECQLKKI